MTSNPLNWLERLLVFLASVFLVVLVFLVLTVALVAGALIASAVIVRWWWLSRKLRRARAQETLEGEYEIVERSGPDQNELPRQNQGRASK